MSERYANRMKDLRNARRATLKQRLDDVEDELMHSEILRKNEKNFSDRLRDEDRFTAKTLEERLRFQIDRSERLQREKKRDVLIFAIAGPLYGIGIFNLCQYLFGVWFG